MGAKPTRMALLPRDGTSDVEDARGDEVARHRRVANRQGAGVYWLGGYTAAHTDAGTAGEGRARLRQGDNNQGGLTHETMRTTERAAARVGGMCSMPTRTTGMA